MIVKFDSLSRLEIPKFYVCSPGSVCSNGMLSNVIGILSDTCDEELVLNFNSISELNFRVYKTARESAEDTEYIYKLYKSLQNRRMIFLDDIGYFVITNVEEGFSEGKSYKDIHAESCEKEIQNKMLPYISNGTYKFIDLFETVVSSTPLWTIGHVDTSVDDRYRTFEDVSTELNCLSFMLDDIQNAYECIICFDCVNRVISVYDQSTYVEQTNIHITKNDVINSIDISEKSDDLYTAITVSGDDNLNISPVNPLGTNVIYNFDYYIDWMSDELREKVISWKEATSSAEDEYYRLNLDYYNKLTEKSNLDLELSKLGVQLTMYQRCRDNIVAEADTLNVSGYNEVILENGGIAIDMMPEISDTINNIDTLISTVNSEISDANEAIEDINSYMNDIYERIVSIRNTISIDNYFVTTSYGVKDTHLLDELMNYVYEGSYTDEYIAVTDIMTYSEKFMQMKTLYDRAVAQLRRISQPLQEFTIDVENFVFIKEFEEWSSQLKTGCLINVELDTDDVAMLFLSTITINYEDKSLNLTFGNRFNKFDTKSLFDKVLGNIQKSANTINYLKEAIYPIKNGEFNSMKEAIENSRTLTKNAVLSSTNEEVVIDDTGYTGRKLVNGEYDPHQVKLTGTNLVFTDDAWETCKVALGKLISGDGGSVYGLNAEAIIGNIIIGEELHIKDKNGRDLLDVVDGKISMSVNGLATKEDVENIELTPGPQGIGVSSTTAFYYLSDYSTSMSGGYWSTEVPEWVDGKYYWQKFVTIYTNGATAETTPVCITGATGSQGIPGIQGEQGIRGERGEKGDSGQTSYFHIKYSPVLNPTASQMTEQPDKYIGTYVDFTSTDSDDPSKYTWARFEGVQGPRGEQGIPGVGADGKTSYLHIKYSNDGGSTFTENNGETVGSYIGTCVNYDQIDPNEVGSYTWARIKGDAGESTYTHIRYSANSDGTSFVSSPTPSTIYIGVYTGTSSTPPTSKTEYKWSKYIGDKGDTGNAGNGINSITYYYLTNNSPSTPSASSITSTTMTVPTSENRYLWQKEVIDFTDSSVADKTTVVLLAVYGETGQQGPKGDNGNDGTSVSITSTSIRYQASTSGTQTPSGTWSTTIPPVALGSYLWTKTVVNYSDGKSTTAYSVAYKGTNGEKGDKGDTGNGINSVTVTYGQSDSPSSQPTSWVTDIPSVPAGKYLWTRTITDYTSASVDDTVTYTYAKQGATGQQGEKGDTGDAGTSVKVSSIKYQSGSSPTTAPSGTWSNNPVAVSDGLYLWTKTTFSDGSIAYGIAKQGEKGSDGENGADGKDGVDGVGINSIEEHYQISASDRTVPTTWQNTPPIITAENRYLWNYETITYTNNTHKDTEKRVIGVYGDTGSKGDAGTDGKSIGSVVNYYLATNASSGVTTSTAGWTTAVQSVSAVKKYLWNYEQIKYTDNTVASTSAPCIIGAYGDKGDTGQTGATGTRGTGLWSVTTAPSSYTTQTGGFTPTYRMSLSTAKSQSGATNILVGDQIRYSYYTYPVGYVDSSYVYMGARVSIRGATGAKGDQGDQGEQGKGVASIEVEFYLSTDNKSCVGGSWQTTMPEWSVGKYLWTRNKITYSNPTSVAYTEPLCDSSWEALTNSLTYEIESVNKKLEEQSAGVTSTAEGVVIEALKGYVGTTEYSDFTQRVESTLKVLSTSIDMDFSDSVVSKLNSSINGLSNSFNELQQSIDKHISFSLDGITITGSSGISLTLDNSGIVFSKNGTNFGTWDGNNFHTGNIIVDVNERAQFGNFAFIPRSDGSLSFLKVGG